MVIELKDFIPMQTFECGQCFRWEKDTDGSYVGVAGKRAVRISAEGSKMTVSGCDENDYNAFWKKYLDAERDYESIKKHICINEVMENAVAFGGGIRILRQEFFETLISFIISQRSSIPRIKTCVNRLCEKYGDKIDFEGKTLYTFPTPERLGSLTEADFAALGVGYRAAYIVDAVKRVLSGETDEKFLLNADTKTARAELMKIRGVGDKVCDCVLLFSLGKYDLFPSDVWIKRVMEESFLSKDAKSSGEKLFGEYSGFAQQYLFYWRRNSKLLL